MIETILILVGISLFILMWIALHILVFGNEHNPIYEYALMIVTVSAVLMHVLFILGVILFGWYI